MYENKESKRGRPSGPKDREKSMEESQKEESKSDSVTIRSSGVGFFCSTSGSFTTEIQAKAMALVAAAKNKDQKMINKLIIDEISNLVALNIEPDEDYFAPYLLALKNEREKVAQMIVIALKNSNFPKNVITDAAREFFSKLLAIFAVEQGHEGCMQELLLEDIDIGIGPLMQTPLNFAAKLGQERAVQILIEEARKENLDMDDFVNAEDLTGCTALMNALRGHHDGVVQYLLENHANANFCSFRGDSPLTVAMSVATEVGYQTSIMRTLIDKLENVATEKSYAERVLDMKFVAHVCGISGRILLVDGGDDDNNKEMILEGFENPYVMCKLSAFVEEFFKSDKGNSAISENDKATIQECIANGFPLVSDPAEILSRIHARKPVVILAGLEDHAISLVICDDKLFVCNRARIRAKDEDMMVATTMAYSLPASSITETMIKSFIKTKSDIKSFDKLTAGLTRLDSDCFSQKNQKVGNCTWASAKGAFAILCKRCSNENTVYKRFTNWAREKVIHDYCDRYIESNETDDQLLELIRGKEKLVHFLRADLKSPPPRAHCL